MTNADQTSLAAAGLSILLLFALGLLTYFRVQKYKKDASRKEQDRIQLAILKENERTMSEIAMDIHDDISQVLSLAQKYLKVVLHKIGDGEIRNDITSASDLITTVRKSLQNISHSLHAPFIQEHGLIAMTNMMVNHINSAGAISCKIDVTGAYKESTPDEELLVYRIAQEAIHNATKHANCTEIHIAFDFSSSRRTMKIVDNGIGFPESEATTTGMGLMNMRHRAHLLNGTLTITSSPGVSVLLAWPSPGPIKNSPAAKNSS